MGCEARFCEGRKWIFRGVCVFFVYEQTLPWYFYMKVSASCRDICSTYWTDISRKEKHLVPIRRVKTESVVSFHGGYFALWKRKALQLLALGIPDEAKTSRTIGYSLNDTMDEMLVGIVCSGYCEKYIIPSRKVSEVAVAGGCCQLVHVWLVKEGSWSHAKGLCFIFLSLLLIVIFLERLHSGFKGITAAFWAIVVTIGWGHHCTNMNK